MRGNKFENTRMRAFLLSFEADLHVNPHAAADVLGVARSTYSKWRTNVRPMPRCVEYHASALRLLPKTRLKALVAERCHA